MVRIRSDGDSPRNASVLDGEEEDGSAEATEEDDEDEYDPQQITVPVTLCLAIMVGYVSMYHVDILAIVCFTSTI